MPDRPRLRDLGGGGPGGAPAALVTIPFLGPEGAARAVAFAERWQAAVPEAAFVGIELDPAVDPRLLRHAASEAAAARAMDSGQLVLFGTGAAGLVAVHSVLRGLLPGAGVIGLDISGEPETPPVLASAAVVRLVQHCGEDDPRANRLHALVDEMRRHELDVRSMVLPSLARTDPAVAMRATGTFLVELVARASRIPPSSGSRP